jgi:hypothetical protein
MTTPALGLTACSKNLRTKGIQLSKGSLVAE